MHFLKEYSLLLEWLGSLSVLTFIGSLIAVPWIIAKLPANYFIRHRMLVEDRHRRHPVAAAVILVVRNTIGVVLLGAGIAMLALPGQGIITILIGISLMDFPRKHLLVDFLVRRERVVRFLNWVRKKEKKPPFEL